jgi:hypothetical protein
MPKKNPSPLCARLLIRLDSRARGSDPYGNPYQRTPLKDMLFRPSFARRRKEGAARLPDLPESDYGRNLFFLAFSLAEAGLPLSPAP